MIYSFILHRGFDNTSTSRSNILPSIFIIYVYINLINRKLYKDFTEGVMRAKSSSICLGLVFSQSKSYVMNVFLICNANCFYMIYFTQKSSIQYFNLYLYNSCIKRSTMVVLFGFFRRYLRR